MFRVLKKLKMLKKSIREFSKINYSDLEKRVKEAHDLMLISQDQMLSNPSSVNAEAEMEAMRKWQILNQAEESFFCQRSKVTWLGLGDSNTAYFHRMAATRNSLNHIHYLDDGSGARIESQMGIQDHCITYFSGILGGPVEPPIFEKSDLDLILPFSCSVEQKCMLTKPFLKGGDQDCILLLT